MKQIKRPKQVFHHSVDIRQEQLRFGRYLYLTLLIIVFALLFHLFFSHAYMLTGQGFVFSNNRLVELEFDAKIERLFTKNGDHIQFGEKVLRVETNPEARASTGG